MTPFLLDESGIALTCPKLLKHLVGAYAHVAIKERATVHKAGILLERKPVSLFVPFPLSVSSPLCHLSVILCMDQKSKIGKNASRSTRGFS